MLRIFLLTLLFFLIKPVFAQSNIVNIGFNGNINVKCFFSNKINGTLGFTTNTLNSKLNNGSPGQLTITCNKSGVFDLILSKPEINLLYNIYYSELILINKKNESIIYLLENPSEELLINNIPPGLFNVSTAIINTGIELPANYKLSSGNYIIQVKLTLIPK